MQKSRVYGIPVNIGFAKTRVCPAVVEKGTLLGDFIRHHHGKGSNPVALNPGKAYIGVFSQTLKDKITLPIRSYPAQGGKGQSRVQGGKIRYHVAGGAAA
jgi:hypothetical protein